MEFVLVVALVPAMGGDFPPKNWRGFLAEDRATLGGRLASVEERRTTLSVSRVKAASWFAGTVEKLYGVSGGLPAIVEAVAVKDHFGVRFGVHPAKVELEGDFFVIEDARLHLEDQIRKGWISPDEFEIVDL